MENIAEVITENYGFDKEKSLYLAKKVQKLMTDRNFPIALAIHLVIEEET